MMSNQAKRKRKSTSVSGQALGYYVQETRITELLARSREETFVSLGLIDDGATETTNGSVSMVQSKSALTADPVSIADSIEQRSGNDYIWHTTGSGKTLTSFEIFTLLKDNPKIVRAA